MFHVVGATDAPAPTVEGHLRLIQRLRCQNILEPAINLFSEELVIQ
jgi:hypothetical protein